MGGDGGDTSSAAAAASSSSASSSRFSSSEVESVGTDYHRQSGHDSPLRVLRREISPFLSIDWRQAEIVGKARQQSPAFDNLCHSVAHMSYQWSAFVVDHFLLTSTVQPGDVPQRDDESKSPRPRVIATVTKLRANVTSWITTSARRTLKQLLSLPYHPVSSPDDVSPQRRAFAIELFRFLCSVTVLHLAVFFCVPTDIVNWMRCIAIHVLIIKLTSSQICRDGEALLMGTLFAFVHMTVTGIAAFGYLPPDFYAEQQGGGATVLTQVLVWLSWCVQAHVTVVLTLDAISFLG
jgi:hypothetical protein